MYRAWNHYFVISIIIFTVLTLQPALYHDAYHYLSFIRSIVFDRDINFTNETQILTPSIQVMLYDFKSTETGTLKGGDFYPGVPQERRGNMFPIGPSILWAPFYSVSFLFPRTLLGSDVPLGYGTRFRFGAALGSLFYILAGLRLCHVAASRISGEKPARIALWSLVFASPLIAYYTRDPLQSEATAFFAASYLVYVSFKIRQSWRMSEFMELGFAIGLASLVRWQNALLTILPVCLWMGFIISRSFRIQQLWRHILYWILCAVTGILVFSPQYLSWFYLFTDANPFRMRLMEFTRPQLINILFSTNRGLFVWTPFLVLGFVGLCFYFFKDRWAAAGLLLLFFFQLFQNSIILDWWGGAGFAARRFTCCLPAFCIGMGYLFSRLPDRILKRVIIPFLTVSIILAVLLLNSHYNRHKYPPVNQSSQAMVPAGLYDSACHIHKLFTNSLTFKEYLRARTPAEGSFSPARFTTILILVSVVSVLGWLIGNPVSRSLLIPVYVILAGIFLFDIVILSNILISNSLPGVS
ncbi:hypothetical protein JXA40_09235 [bacterium]|nr:hypothetical protein [candidate division CSSED10-310 bacterium]